MSVTKRSSPPGRNIRAIAATLSSCTKRRFQCRRFGHGSGWIRSTRASELKQQGVPVELVWAGATIHTTMWCVARGAPNRDLAWQFIQFASQAKPQAEFCNRLFYGPTNPEAFKFLNPAFAKEMPTYPENAKVAVNPDSQWFADNAAKVQERFTQWVAS